jgi:hypothetical protein
MKGKSKEYMKIIGLILALICLLFNVQGKAQLKVGDHPTQSRKSVALDVEGSDGLQGLWLPRVPDTSLTGIRALNPPDGLIIYHPPSGKLFLRSNNSWVSYLPAAITKITAGSQNVSNTDVTFGTGTAAGASSDFNIVANNGANTITFNLPDASPLVRGVVTTGAQTFNGAKAFSNGITVNNGSTLNGGSTANGGLTVPGATGAISNLTLGITSSTTPDVPTNKYLSVNSSGNVTLHSLPTIKTFYQILDGLPKNMPAQTSDRFTFTISGANLSTSSTVFVSPTSTLNNGTSIDWVHVLNSTTIELSISTKGNSQNFTITNNGFYNITVIEF